jgi:hypothetical protein
MEQKLLNQGQKAIYIQDHDRLKQLYSETYNLDYQINISNIYLKLFYYACQHNRKNTIVFLFKLYFEIFSETQQIALRQSFYYGKFKIKDKELINWYSNTIIPIIRN